MGHTEGELKIYESGKNRHLYTGNKGDEIIIAGLTGENVEANAEHLKLCWNSHDKLLAACEDLVKAGDNFADTNETMAKFGGKVLAIIIPKAKAAIAAGE